MEVTLLSAPDNSYIIKTLNGYNELFMEGNNCFVDRSGRDRDYYWEFVPQGDDTYFIRMAASNTYGHTPANYPNRYFGRDDLSSTALYCTISSSNANAQIRWQLVYQSDMLTVELADDDYAALCAIASTLGADEWTKKWDTTSKKFTKAAWPGVIVNDNGQVTAIDLKGNNLNGDISTLTLSTLSALKSLNLSNNAITGDIQTLAATLPTGCKLYVEGQSLGYIGEHTLYEVCSLTQAESGLPSIAYWRSDAATLASTLIGVGGNCYFTHDGSGGSDRWEGRIWADGGTESWGKFIGSSTVTVECTYPQRFTFTYKYEMGDANMDDVLNVLDLQSTLNYSNGQSWGLFNFYAADTYAQDDDINVQDIVSTVNILLAQEEEPAPARTATSLAGSGLPAATAFSTEAEACVSIEAGEIALYTTVPVAALDLRLSGIAPEALSWNTEAMGFTTAATAQANGTHAIIYSLQPHEIAEGRTVLATFDVGETPRLTSAVLSDSKAQSVSVGSNLPTGISTTLNENGEMRNETLYDLQGRKVNGQQRKGLYIENGKKIVIK